MRLLAIRGLLIGLLPFAAAAEVYHIDCADAKWRSLESVNALQLQPGDQLLFRAGCRWTGTLSPKGSGISKRPILIDRDGEGPKPVIRGDGAAAALLLKDQEFWEIANLELTNDAPSEGLRRGVLVVAEKSARTLRHVHLRGLDVHNVKGKLGADMTAKATGGIGFEARGKESPGRFDDIAVEDCAISHLDNTGIYLWSEPITHPRDPRWAEQHFTNVKIRKNRLTDIGKNAIIVRSSLAPVIERNEVNGAAARLHGSAIYVFGCKDAVIQLNEVYNTRYHELEGAAFDSDYNSEGTIIQYNYSHDNGGGLVDFCNNPESKPPRGYNDGAILRYNLSRNGTAREIAFDGPATNTQIYNNTIHVGRGLKPHIIEFDIFGTAPGYADRTWFRNNVIVNEGDGTYLWGKATNFSFEGNCFAGHHPANEPEDPKKQRDCRGVTAPAESPVFEFVEGFVFASPQGIGLKADLYLPKGSGPFPVALYIHGGGWSGGDRTQLRRQAARMASLGVAGFAIEYRLSGQAHYPAAFEDAKAAVQWVRENAAKYHLDASRIAAVGSSAGGHLAALLGVTKGSGVTAVAAFNPVLDLTDTSHGSSSVTKFLGGNCEDRMALCREASPISHVSSAAAPFLILHGTADQTVPYRQAEVMVRKLKAAGVTAELFTAEGGPHTFWANQQWLEPSFMAMEKFLLQHLAQGTR